MGYAVTTPYQIVQTNSSLKNAALLGVGANDFICNSITTPDFVGHPTKCYVDIIVQVIKNNDAVNVNGINTGSTALWDGASFIDCGSITSGSAWVEPGVTTHISYLFPGTTNIATSILPNTNYSSYFHTVNALGNTLELRDIYTRISLYFGV